MIEQLTEEQRAKLPVYREKYLAKFFGENPPAEFEKVEKYIHWIYETFNVSPNKKPTVVLKDSPFALMEEISRISGEKVEWKTPSYYLSAFNPWVAFYDFFDKEVFKLNKSELFNQYKEVLDLNIFWSIPYENYVFVSRNAIKYNRDADKRLHSVHEGAITFSDGYNMYFIHGVAIPKELWARLQSKEYAFADFVRETNEEVKAAILSFTEEKWGSEYLFRFISDNLKEIDTHTDKKDEQYLQGTTGGMNIGVYTLYKGKVDNIDLAFVRCYCPSTDRMFFLSVQPNQKNAKDAIASLYRVPKKLKKHIAYIQRQGERFSTVFDEKGTKMLKDGMSETDLANMVAVTGDEYFTFMKYEY